MVGDPKTSVRSALTLNVPKPVEEIPLVFYPNPTHGHLMMQADLPSGPVRIRVRNMTGQVVFRQESNHYGGAWKHEIDLQSLTAGTYLLQLEAKELSVTKRVAIAH